MAKAQKTDKTLSDLLDHAMKDIYYAERKIQRTLPKIIKACTDRSLAEALSKHRDETSEQITLLESAFELLGKPAKAVRCEAIDGILEEGDGLLEDFGGTSAGDAGIVFACQGVEHYEITRYGTMHTWALELGLVKVAEIFATILEQEKAADQKLTDLAEDAVNLAAEAQRKSLGAMQGT